MPGRGDGGPGGEVAVQDDDKTGQPQIVILAVL